MSYKLIFFIFLIISFSFFSGNKNVNSDSNCQDINISKLLWPIAGSSYIGNSFNTPPKLLKKQKIEFPCKNFSDYEFELLIQINIDKFGKVIAITSKPILNRISLLESYQKEDWILYSKITSLYLNKVVDSLYKWEFIPARNYNNEPVESTVDLLLRFGDDYLDKNVLIYYEVK